MSNYAERKPRIKRADLEIEAVIAEVTKDRSDAEVKALRAKIYGKAAQMAADKPNAGDVVRVTDLFEGTPFFGVPAVVGTDSAMAESGVAWAKQRVMVRFETPIKGRRKHYPFPVAALAVAPKSE